MIKCPACSFLHQTGDASCDQCGFSAGEVDGFPAWAPSLAHEGGGFKASHFAELASLEAGNFWFNARNALITWALGKYFPKLDSLLEIGCGTGYVLTEVSKTFPRARLVGSEIFTAGLGFAATRVPNASLVQMDARSIPYVREFDVVAAFDVIEHIVEDVAVLNNLYQAVKPGGGLLLTVPQHQWLWSAADDYACHERRYSDVELQGKLATTGFEIVRSTSFVSLLLPAMLISRRRDSQKETYDPLAEFQISPWLNSALGHILWIERLLIRAGVNFPLGGSRLVVARKT